MFYCWAGNITVGNLIFFHRSAYLRLWNNTLKNYKNIISRISWQWRYFRRAVRRSIHDVQQSFKSSGSVKIIWDMRCSPLRASQCLPTRPFLKVILFRRRRSARAYLLFIIWIPLPRTSKINFEKDTEAAIKIFFPRTETHAIVILRASCENTSSCSRSGA